MQSVALMWSCWWRLLTFRSRRDELASLSWRRHLGPALFVTWVVGMGRYWDHPSAHWLQMLGVGSLIYVFVLAAFLWVIVRPLNPRKWDYLGVVTVVAMTSPPALLYALPVERWMSVHAAIAVNVWFLAGVALWRVLLLVQALRRMACLTWPRTLVALFLPLAAIVTVLALLNLEHAVFEVMSGLREAPTPTPHDGAYAVVVFLTYVAFGASAPLLLLYLSIVAKIHWGARQMRSSGGASA